METFSKWSGLTEAAEEPIIHMKRGGGGGGGIFAYFFQCTEVALIASRCSTLVVTLGLSSHLRLPSSHDAAIPTIKPNVLARLVYCVFGHFGKA